MDALRLGHDFVATLRAHGHGAAVDALASLARGFVFGNEAVKSKRRGWTSTTRPANLDPTRTTHITNMPESAPEPTIANMQNLINQIAGTKPNTNIKGSATNAGDNETARTPEHRDGGHTTRDH